MKRIITVIAAIAMLAGIVSCSKEESPVNNGEQKAMGQVTLTATIEGTRMSYTEIEVDSKTNLRPGWEKGDALIGIDASDNSTFTLSVAKVNDDGSALLTGDAPLNATVYLIYKASADKDNWTSVDFTKQKGDKTMPVVMFSKNTITAGKGTFAFSNAGSALGIDNAKGLAAGTVISKVTVKGSNLSAATIGIESEALKLTVTEKTDDKISVDGLNVTVGSDEARTLGQQILVALPAGAKIREVSLASDKGTYIYTLKSVKDVSGDKYLYMKTNEFKPKEYYFTTSDDWGETLQKIVFADGNLYSNNAEAPNYKYYFENNQWENRALVAVGDDKAFLLQGDKVVTSTPDNTSGLFQWLQTKTDGYGAFSKTSLDPGISGNASDILDWGEAYGGGWRTLCWKEWAYTLGAQSNPGNREVNGGIGDGYSYKWAKIYTGYRLLENNEKAYMYGTLIFPDNWDDDDPSFKDGDKIPNGCVFLPAAGERLRENNAESQRGKVLEWGVRGMYWACDVYGNDGKMAGGPDLTATGTWVDDDPRAYGMSVRLVKNVTE